MAQSLVHLVQVAVVATVVPERRAVPAVKRSKPFVPSQFKMLAARSVEAVVAVVAAVAILMANLNTPAALAVLVEAAQAI